MRLELIVLLLFVTSIVVLSIAAKKLTVAGALLGGVLAIALYMGAGWGGIVLLGAFFVLGIAATAHKRELKQHSRTVPKESSKRTAGQVWANGGLAALFGFAAFVFPTQAALFHVLMAAGLSSAAADTVSSELGVLYGRKFYNIRTLQPDQRGLDGVISLEGTLLGVAASVVIALLYAFYFGWTQDVIWIIIAGTVGNLSDSWFGATLERAGRLSNNGVNFLNTCLAALVAYALAQL